MTTPLHEATKHKHIDARRLLLEYGAGVDAKNKKKYTPLIEAVKRDYIEGAELLLSYGADVDYEIDRPWSITEESSIYIASAHGNIDMMELLIRYDADICRKHKTLVTQLQQAISDRNDRAVKLLLYLGVPYASHRFKDMKYLCALDIDVNELRGSDGWTMLHYAVLNGNVSAVRLLLSKHARIDIPSRAGTTPMMLITMDGSKMDKRVKNRIHDMMVRSITL